MCQFVGFSVPMAMLTLSHQGLLPRVHITYVSDHLANVSFRINFAHM
jgi:hypothetical protein